MKEERFGGGIIETVKSVTANKRIKKSRLSLYLSLSPSLSRGKRASLAYGFPAKEMIEARRRAGRQAQCE